MCIGAAMPADRRLQKPSRMIQPCGNRGSMRHCDQIIPRKRAASLEQFQYSLKRSAKWKMAFQFLLPHIEIMDGDNVSLLLGFHGAVRASIAFPETTTRSESRERQDSP